MSVINVGEVYYQTFRAEGEDHALSAMESLRKQAIEFVGAGYELTMGAARIKAQFPLSYADCFAAALAQRMRARLVTGDPEFRRLEDAGIIEVEWLSAKTRQRRR
jgi:ribonuclease VapC